MRKLSSVLLSLLALITLSACYNYYVPIPVGPSSPLNPTTPVITVTDEQVQESITEAQEIAKEITTEIPNLPGAGAWNTSDDSGFEYTRNDDGKPTARYGSFKEMMGIDGFVDIGAVNNTINSVSLLGKTYSAAELVSVSVGNSNFVKDYVFKIEKGRLKINMFYYYSSLLYRYGISVNGERVEEYDGSLSGIVTEAAITSITATIKGNSTVQPSSATETNGEFYIVFTLNGSGEESPYIQFGEAKPGDVAIIKKIIDNGDPVVSFDIATTDGTWGAYPYGWQPVVENMENKTEQREYMILRGNEIIHYNLAINYSVK